MELSTEPNTLLYAGIGLFTIISVVLLLTQPTEFAKWVKRRYYTYEVTFALYMLTPTERFIFNSILFLFTSMTCIAAFMYLPAHLKKISERAYYYWAGDSTLWETASIFAQEAYKRVGNYTR